MKNKFRLFIAIIVGLVTAFPLTACGDKEPNAGKPTHIEIYAYKAGFGIDWIDAMAEAFKKKNPEVTFKIWGDSLYQQSTLMAAGPKTNKVSLFITSIWNGNYFAGKGDEINKNYDCVVEPLDDLFSEVIGKDGNGDDITFEQKIMDDYVPAKVNGHYYEVPWSYSMSGLLYNKTAFDAIGINAPRTTKELLTHSETIKNNTAKYGNGKAVTNTPFVFSASTGYWQYIRDMWWMQYEGPQAIQDFWSGIVRVNGRETYSNQIFAQTGRLRSLEALYDCIGHPNGNNHDNVNSLNFTQAQARMIIGEGLMQPNGDWFVNEMKNVADEDENKFDIRIMRTPVISEIIEKCSDTIPDEATLLKVIDVIDGNADRDTIQGVSDDDYEIVSTARKVNYGLGGSMQMYIPVYAAAKDMAKEFLKFIISDEGINIYMDHTEGNQFPFKYDLKANTERWNALSEFQKDCYNYKNDGIFYQNYKNTPFALEEYSGGRNITEIFFAAKNAADRLTAQQIFQQEKDYWSVAQFQQLLKDAGIV